MKTTINTKVYDTDTAVLIADASNHGGNNFRAWEEELYMTQKGNWFLYGWGGPLSEYATHYCNGKSSGARITPITEKEALAWCEKHQHQDVIEYYFYNLIEEA